MLTLLWRVIQVSIAMFHVPIIVNSMLRPTMRLYGIQKLPLKTSEWLFFNSINLLFCSSYVFVIKSSIGINYNVSCIYCQFHFTADYSLRNREVVTEIEILGRFKRSYYIPHTFTAIFHESIWIVYFSYRSLVIHFPRSPGTPETIIPHWQTHQQSPERNFP